VSDPERLARLGAFAERFEDNAFSFGEWGKIGFLQSDGAHSFVQHCYHDGWVLSDFDWPEWKNGEEANEFRDGGAILEHASADVLAKLLTVAIRQDRFVEGNLDAWFRSGLLSAIAGRARDLAGLT
jgi:hypothetical protein